MFRQTSDQTGAEIERQLPAAHPGDAAGGLQQRVGAVQLGVDVFVFSGVP
jgi:hypothetical protein